MQPCDPDCQSVAAHYARQDLEAAILAALVAAGKDPDNLKAEDLAAIDEFHIRGAKATVELARVLRLDSTMQVLDVGCGLGGASRRIAGEFGCRVTGLDLSEEYCRVAASLTRRLGLDSKVSFRQGNALALPFEDGSFEVVWTQHVSMNVADKTALYKELWRVLKPGGRLAIYDILAGPGGEPHYPVPWAREPSISFLLASPQLQDLLTGSGFEVVSWRDVTEDGRSWFRHLGEKIRKEGAPTFSLQLLLGPDFRTMAQNQVLNLNEDRIALVEAVVRRPAGN